MNPNTRKKLNAYLSRVASLNGVDNVHEKFNVAPTISQKLEAHIQESSAFLKLVNHYGTDQQSDEKVGLSVGSSIASRTDTSGAGTRTPVDPTGSDKNTYKCEQTNYDTAFRYTKLDAWAHKPEFQTLLRDSLVRRQALDRIMIGWNGVSVEATTDRVANPLLEDVNIGWMEKLRLEAVARYMDSGATANEIRVGEGGDYKNLDSLVHDMRSNLLGPWYRRDTNFTAIVSDDLVDEKYFPMIDAHSGTPTESNALDIMISNKKMGGLRLAEVPFLPARTIFITLLGDKDQSNLSIMTQNGTRRRHVKDNPEKDQIETFESVNEAYVIEDLTAACASVNIKLPDPGAASGWS